MDLVEFGGNMKKTLVFDMDGTLLNSMGMWRDFSNIIRNSDYKIDYLNNFTPFKNSMLLYTYTLIQEFYAQYSKEKVFKLIDKFLSDFYDDKNLAKPFVHETLDKLSKNGQQYRN